VFLKNSRKFQIYLNQLHMRYRYPIKSLYDFPNIKYNKDSTEKPAVEFNESLLSSYSQKSIIGHKNNRIFQVQKYK